MSEFPVPASEPITIGERIRETRRKRGLSQVDLARAIGVTQPAVANWESGVHDPRRVVLARIADTLDVSATWLANGARSLVEADKHPAAAYIRRPLQHTPVISFADAARFFERPDTDPHVFAEDYIPMTSSLETLFAVFADDPAVNVEFHKGALVIVDYANRAPVDGAFALFHTDDLPVIRRWRETPARLEPSSFDAAYKPTILSAPPKVIGCVKISIRFH